MKAFYKRWYNPSHATVLIVGQVNVPEVVEKLTHTLGSIPSSRDDKPIIKFDMSYAKGASWMHIVDSIQSESKLEVIVPHPTCVRRTLQDVVTKQRMRMLLQC